MIQFDEKELEITGYAAGVKSGHVPFFRYPVSRKEAYRAAVVERKPIWLINGTEVKSFCPDVIPDDRARGYLAENRPPLKDEEKGGRDMFGVEWVYVPSAGGSMEKPGAEPLFDDANDWREAIVWPELDQWDWAESEERNREYLAEPEFFHQLVLLNGFGFERLISFMGFENAAMAVMDEDQEDALLELLDQLSDFYCRLIDRCCETYKGIDSILIHDDWGSQRSAFFSPAVAEKFFVPNMKKVTDRIHAHGKAAELHSCGANGIQVENLIAAGWDTWNPMGYINDTPMYHQVYGDRMVFGIMPEPFDPGKESADEWAGHVVRQFCSTPGKVCSLNRNFFLQMTDETFAALYRASREAYAAWER